MLPSTPCPIGIVMMPVKLFSLLTPTVPSSYSTVRLPSKKIRHLCPSISTILINTCREHTDLNVDGTTILFQEGTTQADPLAMPMYALAILPLIHQVNHDIDQVWYADDATATGTFAPGCRPWSSIWLPCQYIQNLPCVAKQAHHAAALSACHDTQITITVVGRPHLRAALGTSTFLQHYVKRKVEGWAQELNQLASIAANNPHAAYAAFTHGLSGRWTFLARTIPNISHLMQPLEDIIQSILIPNLTG